ncbi:hypothetical protein [Streptomyces sp. T12]|uniref:hypothetical protein n=1 Tax=Streptomyces sp. T12 TaxID=477697 RepID=UPI0021BDE7A0|nr:hypothetical protein [Streptomyces sp. T12]
MTLSHTPGHAQPRDPGVRGHPPGQHSTFDEEWARVVFGYGLAPVVHLFIGHAIAGRLRRH